MHTRRVILIGRLTLKLSLGALGLLFLGVGSTATAKDNIKPTITAVATSVDGTPRSASGWYRSSVIVSFTCKDGGGSGLAFCPPAQTVTSDGAVQVVSGTARDGAGNTATASISLSIDKTAPLITVALSPAANSAGYRNTAVTARFTCSDGLSGVPTCPADRVFATDGTYTVSGTATDKAGNSASAMATFTVDLTPPTISTTMGRAPNAKGWYTAPVSASFACADALSGVGQCPAALTIATEGANQPINANALDRAGNSSSSNGTASLDMTAPALALTSPANGATLTTDAVTITGTSTDAVSGVASVTAGAAAAVLNSNGTFTLGPLPLAVGTNTFTVVSTDRAGLSTSQTLSVTRSGTPPPPTAVNLVQDPLFESGVSGFEAQDASSSVTQSAVAPLEGAYSLRVSIAGYGNNLWWSANFAGGLASRFSVGAHLRSDVQSSSALQFCAMVYYADGSTALNCTPVSGALGDKGVVAAQVDLDPSRRLDTVRIRLIQEGGAPVAFTLDQAVASLVVIEAPPSGGSTGGGSSGGSTGGRAGSCTAAASSTSAYPGFTYQLPTARPFVSLSRYAQVDRASTAYTRFKSAADSALAGNPPYAYSATHSVIMYRLTGTTSYIDDAIARVETLVAEAEATIAAGGRPVIAADSYLEVGFDLEDLSLAYDYGYARLTASQLQRWSAFAETTLQNLWNPATASWGGVAYPWSGWSLCDPGNNYHFSFLRATMLWALASQNPTWLNFLQTKKFGPLVDYYAQLPGGGSREGTGYGTALKNLFLSELYWVDSTGENLAGLTSHTRETIEYWVHATVPTLDRFAPIGDQSRSSMPDLYDYHENLVHTAVVLSQGTTQARHGTWWLANNSVNGVSNSFNLSGDLLPFLDTPLAPTDLFYHATGAGALFARSSWSTDAAWLAIVAGKYDQSHAHQDQGSFTFFRRDWLAVTPNIWSRSGINQDVGVHNVVRFERADGSSIPQSPSDTLQSSMQPTSSGGQLTVAADLTNAYWRDQTSVQSWTRTFEFVGNVLRVTDVCRVAAGVRPVFQLHVPTAPQLQTDGSVRVGQLTIVPLQGVTVSWTAMSASEFSQGYRLDFRPASGCSFKFELRAQ